MATAQKSMGTTLRKTSGTTKIIVDLTSIGEIGVESSETDVTTLDSPNGYRETIATLKDAGEVPFSGFIKSEDNIEVLLALAELQSIENWRIESPLGAKWDFSAFVKMVKEGEASPEGVRSFSGSLRISGKPNYTTTGVSA